MTIKFLVNDAEGAPRFKLTRFGDVALDTSASYLVQGLIPNGGLTVAWGPPKCGKSFWTFYLMMHVALGVPRPTGHGCLYRAGRQQGLPLPHRSL